jgi:hypothetical protein
MSNQIKSTRFLIEENPSPSINSPSVLVADYLSVSDADLKFYLPDTEKTNDSGRSGRDVASHQCNEYWKQDDRNISDDIDFIVLPRLLRRGMGGTPTRTTVATGVYDFEWGIMPGSVSNILPAFGLYSLLGDADFLFWGNTVDKIKLSQTKSARVQAQTTMVGTGGFTKDAVGMSPLPAQVSPACSEGRKVVAKYTDETSTEVNLSSLGGLVSWEFDHDNLLQRNKRASGDPGLAVSGVEAGYVRRIPRGNQNETYKSMLSFVPMFEDLSDWIRSVALKEMTDFSIMIPGPKIATVSSVDYFNELEIIIPKFGFENIQAGNDDGEGTTPVAVMPFEDPVTKGSFTVRLRTTEASFEGVSS